ncbi:MAG TPA: flagellar hook-associated protein FlgL [Thermodesulfovibrionales bacterium]|nr:flagellar hook-associated protein FlgL [Thermodesulfovibrionales bacterium]
MMVYAQMAKAMQDAASQLADANTQLATGKKINKPSDDPAGEAQAIDYKVSIQTNTQYENNMQQANIFLDATDKVFTSAADTLSNLKDLASAGINNQTQETKDANSQQAAGYRDFLLGLANTKVGNRYLFSGFKTDQQAFTFNAVTNTFDYNGDLGSIQVPIDANSSMATNVQGSTAFRAGLGGTMPAALSDGTPVSYTQAKDPVTGVNTITVEIGNVGDPDYDTFRVTNVMDIANVVSFAWKNQNVDGTALDPSADISQEKAQHRMDALDSVIDAARSQVLAQQAEVGARGDVMNDQKTRFDQMNLSLESARAKIEDADINQTYVDMQQASVALQALQSSAAKVLSTSLLDFLQ